MSSAYAKQKLKQSRDAIQKKDWATAAQAASDVLESDSQNYNANVFLGLALLNLERYQESEKAYLDATASQPDQPLAWQGLEKFYSSRKKWDECVKVLLKQVELFHLQGEPTKCAEAFQRLLAVQREEGSRLQRAETLSLLLPDSPYYSTFASLPFPDQTNPTSTTTFETEMNVHVNSLDVLNQVIGLIEYVERDSIDKEVEKRRLRLDRANKGKEAVRNEVKVEVMTGSRLPKLYDQLLSHPSAPDELRRETESKLLRHHHQLLLALPNPDSRLGRTPSAAAAVTSKETEEQERKDREAIERKASLRDTVTRIAEGMVIIGVDDEMAWSVGLEWKNVESLVDLARDQLRSFVSLFPRSGRTLSIKAFLLLIKDEQFFADEEELKKESDIDADASAGGQKEEDLLNMAIDGLEACPDSILCHRVAATLYLLDRDYLSASEVVQSALNLVARSELEAALDLSQVRQGLELILATSYTHLHPPQNHARAQRLADSVLSRSAYNVQALLAKAYIEQEAGRWQEARNYFVRAQQASSVSVDEPLSKEKMYKRALSPSKDPALQARGEIAWCDVKLGRLQEAKAELEDFISLIDPLSTTSVTPEDRARAWWRLGSCMWEMGGEWREDVENSFKAFITCLKRSPAFAPAFTSLGIYYETVSSPPDFVRASKCFQKAFELDARENEAARRLAVGFADEREWDLVEVVARRTVEGEGGAEALRGEMASQRRHQSKNAWAWKAIGSVELERKHYDESISAYQVALRAAPQDANSWQRLGEAYAGSGRHVAAIKSFSKALELRPDDWQVKYCIADVQRALGQYEIAIKVFADILDDREGEIGVRVALAETLLMQARLEYRTGYVERCEASLLRALTESEMALRQDENLRSAWKIISDSCFELSRLGSLVDSDSLLVGGPVEDVIKRAKQLGTDDKLPSIRAVSLQTVRSALSSFSSSSWSTESSLVLSELAAYLYKLRVILNANDENSAGGAWYDLSVSLHHLARHLSKVGLDEEGSEAAVEGSTSERIESLTRQSIACIKEALRSQPGNETFWLVLGNLTFKKNVNLSQHCYIRAIESSPKSAIPWTNLGFLYLEHDDVELANEAFIKAQTCDPDHAPAWVGQALVATAFGDPASSRALFEHSYRLCEGSIPEADYGFANAVFEIRNASSSPLRHGMEEGTRGVVSLHSPSFALDSYLSQRPNDTDALLLSALIAESLGQSKLAIERIERVAALLEEDFERSESEVVAQRYAIAESNLGRIRLTVGDHSGSKAAHEATLGLLDLAEGPEGEEGEEGAKMREKLKRVKIHSLFGRGLACFFLGENREALEGFEECLGYIDTLLEQEEGQTYEGRARQRLEEERVAINVLLAKILWSFGGQEQREAAKSQLLESISMSPNNIGAITTLAAMGIASGDSGLVDAALSEIKEMPIQEVRQLDANRDVPFLLSMERFSKGDIESGLSTLRSEVEPNDESTRSRLNLLESIVSILTQRVVERGQDEGKEEDEWTKGLREEAQRISLEALAMITKDWSAEKGVGDTFRLGSMVAGVLGGGGETKCALPGPKYLADRALVLEPWKRENWEVAEMALGGR
ncbi:TPR-like protein [Violaceomyces palustris]|uniref:TPR-like protein n=1 Tax=Violaceomyces palustris TaxID=1673888 RepID=A0ACD0NMP9_9BASI|nr:TPR-like protein [Violaceomyces palustris]